MHWSIKTVVLAVALVLGAAGLGSGAVGTRCVAAAPATSVVHVDAAAAGRLLSTNRTVVVLEVRTPREFAEGHIKGATNVNFNADKFSAEIGKLDRGQSYLVHCAAGGRSTKSLEVFQKLGFKSIYHLDGGLKAWQDAGQPVTASK